MVCLESPEKAGITDEEDTSYIVEKTIVAQSLLGDHGFRLSTGLVQFFRFLSVSHYT